jgi:membrane-associated protein
VPLAVGFDLGVNSAAGFALYAVVWAAVFVESGLLIGFFLPGDTLLFAAGVAAATGRANIVVLMAGCVVFAIVGDSVGYLIGKRAGRPLLQRRDGRVLNQHNLKRATDFYDRYGSATIVIARVVPMVRTFAPLIAGCTEMQYRKFLMWNVIGGLAWGTIVPYAGYLVGESVPGVEKYALAAAGLMVVLSLISPVVHYIRAGKQVEEPTEDAELVP